MKFRGALSEGQNYQVAFDFENIQVELIEPAGSGESNWKESLAKNGSCIHYIAFESLDMQADQRAFAARGTETLQEGTFPGGAYAYMDTQKKLGAIIEMLYIDFDTVKRKPGTSDRDSFLKSWVRTPELRSSCSAGANMRKNEVRDENKICGSDTIF